MIMIAEVQVKRSKIPIFKRIISAGAFEDLRYLDININHGRLEWSPPLGTEFPKLEELKIEITFRVPKKNDFNSPHRF